VRIEIYDKGDNLIASWDVDLDTCERFKELSDEEVILEVATGIGVSLKDMGIELSLNGIVNEWGRLRVCGREIVLEAGNSRL